MQLVLPEELDQHARLDGQAVDEDVTPDAVGRPGDTPGRPDMVPAGTVVVQDPHVTRGTATTSATTAASNDVLSRVAPFLSSGTHQ